MAQITLTITIPDEHEVQQGCGLRAHWGQVEDPPGSGIFRDLTKTEIRDKLQILTRATIRNIVTNQESQAAVQQVNSSYDAIGVS